MDHLSDEEKARLGLQVDLFVDLLAKRYGVHPAEAVEAVKWVQTHRDFVSRVKNGGLVGLIGVLVTASLITFWEGVKNFMGGGKTG